MLICNRLSLIRLIFYYHLKLCLTGPNSNTSMHQKLKLVARQNRRLRELLRLEFAPEMSAKDFCLLNIAQITELIGSRKMEKQEDIETVGEGKTILFVIQINCVIVRKIINIRIKLRIFFCYKFQLFIH